MATVLNTIYPPIVETFMPAFLYTESARIYFSLSTLTSPDKIEYIHVAISNQKTNKNSLIAKTDGGQVSVEGTDFLETREKIIRPAVLPIKFPGNTNDVATETQDKTVVGYDDEKGMYFFEVPPYLIDGEKWIPDQFYKVQIRFQISGADEDPTSYYGINIYESDPTNMNAFDITGFNNYLLRNAPYFSEWSTVCLLRPIYIPDIYSIDSNGGYIKGLNKFIGAGSRAGEAPVFPIGELRLSGLLKFADSIGEISTITTGEKLSRYKMYITNEDDEIVDDLVSNYKYTADLENVNEINTTFDITGLEIYKNSETRTRIFYYLNLDVETTNGYCFSRKWKFGLSDHQWSTPWTMWPIIDNLNGNITFLIRQDSYTFDDNDQLASDSYINEKCEEYENSEATALEKRSANTLASNWGCLHVKRASSKTNFSKWEKVKTYYISKNRNKNNKNYELTNMVFIDNTAESLTGYRYRLQFENGNQYMYKMVGIKIDDDDKTFSKLSIDSNLLDDWKTDSEKEFTYMPKFYGALFSRNDRQLRLGLDFKVSSLTPVVSRVKVDTLGSKYPKFAENGLLNYRQLSITGTISSQDDNGRDIYQTDYADYNGVYSSDSDTTVKYIEELGTFFGSKVQEKDANATQLPVNAYKKVSDYDDADESDLDILNHRYYASNSYDYTGSADGGKQAGLTCLGNITKEDAIGSKFYKYYYETEFCNKHGSITEIDSSTKKYTVSKHYKRWNNDLEDNDYMWEREFRKSVMDWLNDGEPKLMRTMTEGNLVVMLTDVSLTPLEGTSRRIYTFQATAYEVAEAHSLSTLNSLGIYKLTEKTVDKNDTETGTFEDKKIIYNAIDFCYSNNTEDNYRIIGGEKSYIKNKIDNFFSNSKSSGSLFKQALSMHGAPAYLTDVKMKFKSAPHLYDKNGNIIEQINEDTEIDFIGYKVCFSTGYGESPQTFFVDRRGYFQIPSKYKVYELYFPDMEKYNPCGDLVQASSKDGEITEPETEETTSAVLNNIINIINPQINAVEILENIAELLDSTSVTDAQTPFEFSKKATNDIVDVWFVVNFRLVNQDTNNSADYLGPYVIGQETGWIKNGTDLSDLIMQKYNVVKNTTSNGITKKESQEWLNYWQGLFIESNPYAVFDICYKKKHDESWDMVETASTEIYEDKIYMNESGYLNISNPNFEVVSFKVVGRKFFNADRTSNFLNNKKYKYSNSNLRLRENDFVFSVSETNKHQTVYLDDDDNVFYMNWNGNKYKVNGIETNENGEDLTIPDAITVEMPVDLSLTYEGQIYRQVFE